MSGIDVDKLDFKYKHFVRTDACLRLSVGAVSELAGDVKGSFAALGNLHEAFAETGHNALEIKCSRTATIGGIENFTVEVLAGIVYNDCSLFSGLVACAFSLNYVYESGGEVPGLGCFWP